MGVLSVRHRQKIAISVRSFADNPLVLQLCYSSRLGLTPSRAVNKNSKQAQATTVWHNMNQGGST